MRCKDKKGISTSPNFSSKNVSFLHPIPHIFCNLNEKRGEKEQFGDEERGSPALSLFSKKTFNALVAEYDESGFSVGSELRCGAGEELLNHGAHLGG